MEEHQTQDARCAVGPFLGRAASSGSSSLDGCGHDLQNYEHKRMCDVGDLMGNAMRVSFNYHVYIEQTIRGCLLDQKAQGSIVLLCN